MHRVAKHPSLQKALKVMETANEEQKEVAEKFKDLAIKKIIRDEFPHINLKDRAVYHQDIFIISNEIDEGIQNLRNMINSHINDYFSKKE